MTFSLSKSSFSCELVLLEETISTIRFCRESVCLSSFFRFKFKLASAQDINYSLLINFEATASLFRRTTLRIFLILTITLLGCRRFTIAIFSQLTLHCTLESYKIWGDVTLGHKLVLNRIHICSARSQLQLQYKYTLQIQLSQLPLQISISSLLLKLNCQLNFHTPKISLSIFYILLLVLKFVRSKEIKMGWLANIIIIVFVCRVGDGFVIAVMKNEKKCFYSSIFAANTILIKFGLPRPDRYNCKVQFTVDSQPLATEASQAVVENYTHLYNATIQFHKRTPRQLSVLKYSNEPSNLSIMKYRMCVTGLDDFYANKTFFELIITEKEEQSFKDPGEGENYVSSKEFFEFQQTCQAMKKRLSWCLEQISQADLLGKQIQLMLKQESQLAQKLTWIQIGFLLLYGLLWIYFMRLTILGSNRSIM